MGKTKPLRIQFKGWIKESREDFWIRAAIELLESSASMAILTSEDGDETGRITREHARNRLEEAKPKLEAECDPDKFRKELEAVIAESTKAKKRLNKVEQILKQEAPVT